MKQLEINITKAALKSFSVTLDDGKPEVSASIALLTEGGKAITTYSLSTSAWNDKDKFDLPVNAIPPIVEIAKLLEVVVTKHCRDAQLALPSGDAEDAPINLDDIPF